MSITRQEMYVMTDAKNNNNKFWEITLHQDGQVKSRNGRVGASGVVNDLGHGESLFNSKVREKIRKGYTLVPVVTKSQNTEIIAKEAVQRAAQEQIAKGDPVLNALIKRLTEANRHQLLQASGGQIEVNLDSGIVKTPVGVVTMQNIQSARDLLPKLQRYVSKENFASATFMKIINEYLMLVPQKVGSRQGWHQTFIPDVDALKKQAALLDQLESSVELAEKAVRDQVTEQEGKTPALFDVQIKIVEDETVIKSIESLYLKTLKSIHSSSKLRPVRVYEVIIPTMKDAWDNDGAKMDNQQFLWHGTRTHNLLSILKQGLIIPKSSGSIEVTGRMFGDGLYFSDQSSKSLNYSHGYWGGGQRDNNCFMFLADVAMGNSYKPARSFSGTPPKPYDSTFVAGGTASVLNNEMIVYRTSQANLRYLVEFA